MARRPFGLGELIGSWQLAVGSWQLAKLIIALNTNIFILKHVPAYCKQRTAY